MKNYTIKVYDKDGRYLKTLSDADFGPFSKSINGGLGECTFTLARTIDSYGEGYDVEHFNEFRIYQSGGAYAPPEGRLIYSGLVSSYSADWEEEKGSTIKVTTVGYLMRLAKDIYEQSANEVTIVRNSKATSDNMKHIIDCYRAANSTIDQSYTTGGDTASLFGSTNWRAQSFTTGAGITNIAQVAVRLKYNTGTADVVRCRIFDDNGGKPGSLVSGADVSTSSALTNTSYKWLRFVFTPSVTLSAGTKYWIVLSSAGSSATDTYHTQIDSTSSTYSGGEFAYSNDSGANWTVDSGQDILFRTYYIDEDKVRVNYTATSITASGDSVSYTFGLKTYLQAIKKNWELAYSPGETWYWFLDENNTLNFKKASSSADHTFTFGKDIIGVRTRKSIEELTNRVIFWNGETGGSKIFQDFSDSGSVSSYGQATRYLHDGRVTASGTASAMANALIQDRKDPRVNLVLTISNEYDIEAIQPGETCRIVNLPEETQNTFGTNMLIYKVTYYKDYAELEIANKFSEVFGSLRALEDHYYSSITEDSPTRYD